MNRDDINLVGAALICAFALVLLGYENGHRLSGLTMVAIGFASMWVAPWLWLKAASNSSFLSPSPGNAEEAAAFRSAAALILRTGILVWLAGIAYAVVPDHWSRHVPRLLIAVSQVVTPSFAAWLGFRARSARKTGLSRGGASASPQADQTSSRTP